MHTIMGSKEFREWFRTIRFFERQRGWFFLSPDGMAVGPYASERDAEAQAVRLAKILKRLDDSRCHRVAVIEFALGSTTHEGQLGTHLFSAKDPQRLSALR